MRRKADRLVPLPSRQLIPAGPRTGHLLDPVRLEHHLTDRAGLGVPLAPAGRVAGMGTEFPETSEGLAAVLAGSPRLLHVGLGFALANLAAIDHVAARLGRDRSAAPQARATLPPRNAFGPRLGGLCGLTTGLAAIHAVRG